MVGSCSIQNLDRSDLAALDLSGLIARVVTEKAGLTERFDAFAELVRRYRRAAVGYASARLADREGGEDAAQEAFHEVWRRVGSLRDPSAFPSWLRRLVATQCARVERQGSIATVPLDTAAATATPGAGPLRGLEQDEASARIVREIHALPVKQREAAALHYLAERSQAEIAAFLDIPPGTVKSRLFNARRRLQHRLADMTTPDIPRSDPSDDDAFVASVTFVERVRAGDHDGVRAALRLRVELATTPYPRPNYASELHEPIHYAVRAGDAEMVALLLDHGADPLMGWHRNEYVPCPLRMAEDRDDADVAQLLEEAVWRRLDAGKDALTATDGEGNTVLHLAVYHGRPGWVARLVERGADVNAANAKGFRPIHMAAPFGCGSAERPEETDKESIARLFEQGAMNDIWLASALGEAEQVRAFLAGDRALANWHNGLDRGPGGIALPLTIAAYQGHEQVCTALLNAGADVDARSRWSDEDEWGAPLLFAISHGHWAVAHMLLDHGALPQSPGIDSGWAVADAAYVCDNREIADRITLAGGRPTLTAYVHKRDYVVLNEIMYRDAEAVVDVLMCAIYWGDLRLVKSCLDRDPVVGSRDYEALMQIAYTWRADIDMLVETLRLLLDHGVDPNARDSETGKTALIHYSWVAPPNHRSESDMLRLVAVLLDAGADPDAQKPDAGTTALAGAASTGSAELVALLLARGASPDLPADDEGQTPVAHAEREGHPHIAELLRRPL